MAFRTVEVTRPSELHVDKGLLHIEQEEGLAVVALEDIANLILCGPGIRISAGALAVLARESVMVVFCDRNHRPAGVLTSLESNTRQALVAQRQVDAPQEFKDVLWARIVTAKIENQARCLELLDRYGSREVRACASELAPGDPENREGAAARLYFPCLHPGLSRRSDDPFNSVLNYGYAIVRSQIARSLITTGFITCIGLHHRSQLNSLNLADDMIEPFRAMVDIVAPGIVGTSQWLTREQRHRLVGVLHHACMIDGHKTDVLTAIDIEADSLARAIMTGSADELLLPKILEPEFVEGVEE